MLTRVVIAAGMKLLKPKTVATILDVHRTTASRMMKNGVLPGFELLPGEWRVYEEALVKFVKGKQSKSRTAKTNGHSPIEENEHQTPAVQASGNHS